MGETDDNKTGFQFRYRVAMTDTKGWGVFAGEKIRKGSVVWRHVPGVFVVYDEKAFRAKIESMSAADVVYELTHVHAIEDFPGCLIRAMDDGALINHSRDATLVTSHAGPPGVQLDVSSPHYVREVARALGSDRYALVATRDIEVGEELTNDYSIEDACPAYYDILYEQYGVREDFLDDGK